MGHGAVALPYIHYYALLGYHPQIQPESVALFCPFPIDRPSKWKNALRFFFIIQRVVWSVWFMDCLCVLLVCELHNNTADYLLSTLSRTWVQGQGTESGAKTETDTIGRIIIIVCGWGMALGGGVLVVACRKRKIYLICILLWLCVYGDRSSSSSSSLGRRMVMFIFRSSSSTLSSLLSLVLFSLKSCEQTPGRTTDPAHHRDREHWARQGPSISDRPTTGREWSTKIFLGFLMVEYEIWF